MSHIPAFELIFFRSLVSLILSYSFLRYHKIPVFGNNKKYLFLRGIFGVIALTFFFITIQNIPLASAVTLQFLSPIFTALFAIWMLHEKMKKMQWLFFAIAFAGVALIKGFDERVSYSFLGLGLASAVFAGLAYNCVRKLKDTDHPVVVVMYFPLMATPIMAILSLYVWVQPSWEDWILLVLMGVFTQIGQVFMTRALQAASIAKVMSLKYLGAVYALLYGYVFFDEFYSGWSLAGIFLVISGIVLNLLYKSRFFAKKETL